MKEDLVKKSKYLSKILRHSPESIGLKLEDDGWLNISDLLSKQNVLRKKDLDSIVENDSKGRYQFNHSKTKIRAVQGHSVDVSINYSMITPPLFLYHGTKSDALQNIFSSGLMPMKRQFVHCHAEKKIANQVAERRKGTSVILQVRAFEYSQNGGEWYLADNQVWLTKHVPAKYLSAEW